MTILSRIAVISASVGLLFTATPPALALHTVDFDRNDANTVFFVAKSQNSNELHYGLKLDEQCRPEGSRPVVAYWRMLEEGPDVVESLTKRERKHFGIAWQRPHRQESGGHVDLSLRALERPLRIVAQSTDSGCEARAVTRIDATAAILDRAWVEIGFLSVSYVDLFGRTPEGGRVRERIDW